MPVLDTCPGSGVKGYIKHLLYQSSLIYNHIFYLKNYNPWPWSFTGNGNKTSLPIFKHTIDHYIQSRNIVALPLYLTYRQQSFVQVNTKCGKKSEFTHQAHVFSPFNRKITQREQGLPWMDSNMPIVGTRDISFVGARITSFEIHFAFRPKLHFVCNASL